MHGLGSLVEGEMQLIDLFAACLETKLKTFVESIVLINNQVKGFIEMSDLTRQFFSQISHPPHTEYE